jgi:hypothetical protein
MQGMLEYLHKFNRNVKLVLRLEDDGKTYKESFESITFTCDRSSLNSGGLVSVAPTALTFFTLSRRACGLLTPQ